MADPHSPSTSRPLIIVAYASVGSGHRSAAKAVAQAFDQIKATYDLLPGDVEIKLVDILDYGYVRFSGEATTNLFIDVRPIYDLTWHYVLTGRILWSGGSAWSYFMYEPFTRLVRERRPLAVVATHIVAANAAVAARMVTGQEFPVTCVPTDYGLEGLWPCKYADLFCVTDSFMVKELAPRKVPAENMRVTGIPVSTDFTLDYDRDAVLEEFGLPTDKTITLVMAGAKWREPYVLFRQMIDEAFARFDEFPHLHFVVIAGEDDEYAAEIRRRVESFGLDNVTVLGYVDKMAALMNAADLAIAKSGGLTVTECICAHLPLLLLGTSYGQERANTETVVRAGAAYQCVTALDLVEMLRRIHANPVIVQLMRENGSVLRRPDAALDVALSTLFKVGEVGKLPNRLLSFRWGRKPVRVR